MKFTLPNSVKLSPSYVVLFAFLGLTCTVDLLSHIKIAGVSGLGASSLIGCGAVWACWLLRPVLPARLLSTFVPLILFELDAAGTLLWYRPGIDGVQLLVVGLLFLGLLMLTARETAQRPELAVILCRTVMLLAWLPTLADLYFLFTKSDFVDQINFTRPFALYALPAASVALATWRGSRWPEPRRYQPPIPWSLKNGILPLVLVFLIVAVLMLGGARTGLIVISLLIPLSLAYRGSRNSILTSVVMLAFGGVAFAIALNTYKPLYDRFFHEDASLQVGGVSINASGRTRIWALLFATIKDDWVCGKGLSSSEEIISRTMPDVGQPHNDYIRFYYDQGIIGLSIWLLAMGTIAHRMIKNLRRSIRHGSDDYPIHLAGLLALTGVSFSMLTDNSFCYSFTMVPLAVVVGCSIGMGAARRTKSFTADDLEPMTEQRQTVFA